MKTITCIAPVNIAVIKYWGKRDEVLILPINDSISASLSTDELCAKTTVMASETFEVDRIWLNGKEESMNNPRIQSLLKNIKKRCQMTPEMRNWKIHICSRNNFPTAAGLASSAAGYACLSVALAKLYNYNGDISLLARLGSGSACRSVYGGFVRWYMGSDPEGNDSIAKQIAPASHWPEMRIIILVVNDMRKKISSAAAMKRGVETSEYLRYRAKFCVPARVEEMHQAIVDKDFAKFAELTMKDSNQMHAACLDTYPPCFYLTDTTHSIINLIHQYNSTKDGLKVAYTNDAGPNTVLYLLEENVSEVLNLLTYFYPPESKNTEYIKGNPPAISSPSENLLEKINCEKQSPGQLKYIIYTNVGDGPVCLQDPKEHLLTGNGLPKAF